jgi:argininosuccinate lyase
MADAADSPHASATDLAEFLVLDGVPFREAHAVVGALVRRSLEDDIPLVDLVRAEPALGERAVGLLAPGESVRRRTTPGGAGPVPVAIQLASLSERLAAERARLSVPPG